MSGVIFITSFIACGCGIDSLFTGGAMIWCGCFLAMVASGYRVVTKE